MQDTAYQSLLKSTRQQSHRQIAQVLEKKFSETTENQPELVAHHYTEAGLAEQAIPYWQRAGEKATQRSANSEALSHLSKGLALLKTLPDTPERTQQELLLQVALGRALIAARGFGVPEVEHAYTRARALCRQVGETPQLSRVLGGLYAFYIARAELQTTRELGEQLLRLAQSMHDPALLLRAYSALGPVLFHLGEVASAQEHLEQGIALYNPQKHRSRAFLQDPGVVCLSYAVLALWHLGYPDQALKRSHEALTLAQELSHPYSLGFALNWVATLHQLRREGQLTQERVESVIVLSTEQGFPPWLAIGTILRGWVLTEQGQGEEGITQMRQGLAAHRATGAELMRSYHLALLAEACGKGGQAEEGLSVLAETLAAVDKTGERYYEAELYRLRGELLLAQEGSRLQAVDFRENTTEAEECFHKAIDVARKQQAKSLELRAVLSLARLWQQQGKRHAACDMLSTIYNWFTEGFDTKDLQEAKSLLEELKDE